MMKIKFENFGYAILLGLASLLSAPLGSAHAAGSDDIGGAPPILESKHEYRYSTHRQEVDESDRAAFLTDMVLKLQSKGFYPIVLHEKPVQAASSKMMEPMDAIFITEGFAQMVMVKVGVLPQQKILNGKLLHVADGYFYNDVTSGGIHYSMYFSAFRSDETIQTLKGLKLISSVTPEKRSELARIWELLIPAVHAEDCPPPANGKPMTGQAASTSLLSKVMGYVNYTPQNAAESCTLSAFENFILSGGASILPGTVLKSAGFGIMIAVNGEQIKSAIYNAGAHFDEIGDQASKLKKTLADANRDTGSLAGEAISNFKKLPANIQTKIICGTFSGLVTPFLVHRFGLANNAFSKMKGLDPLASWTVDGFRNLVGKIAERDPEVAAALAKTGETELATGAAGHPVARLATSEGSAMTSRATEGGPAGGGTARAALSESTETGVKSPGDGSTPSLKGNPKATAGDSPAVRSAESSSPSERAMTQDLPLPSDLKHVIYEATTEEGKIASIGDLTRIAADKPEDFQKVKASIDKLAQEWKDTKGAKGMSADDAKRAHDAIARAESENADFHIAHAALINDLKGQGVGEIEQLVATHIQERIARGENEEAVRKEVNQKVEQAATSCRAKS